MACRRSGGMRIQQVCCFRGLSPRAPALPWEAAHFAFALVGPPRGARPRWTGISGAPTGAHFLTPGCHLGRQLRPCGLLDGAYCTVRTGITEQAAIRAACAGHHPRIARCSSPCSSPSGWPSGWRAGWFAIRMASEGPHGHPDGHPG